MEPSRRAVGDAPVRDLVVADRGAQGVQVVGAVQGAGVLDQVAVRVEAARVVARHLLLARGQDRSPSHRPGGRPGGLGDVAAAALERRGGGADATGVVGDEVEACSDGLGKQVDDLGEAEARLAGATWVEEERSLVLGRGAGGPEPHHGQGDLLALRAAAVERPDERRAFEPFEAAVVDLPPAVELRIAAGLPVEGALVRRGFGRGSRRGGGDRSRREHPGDRGQRERNEIGRLGAGSPAEPQCRVGSGPSA